MTAVHRAKNAYVNRNMGPYYIIARPPPMTPLGWRNAPIDSSSPLPAANRRISPAGRVAPGNRSTGLNVRPRRDRRAGIWPPVVLAQGEWFHLFLCRTFL